MSGIGRPTRPRRTTGPQTVIVTHNSLKSRGSQLCWKPIPAHLHRCSSRGKSAIKADHAKDPSDKSRFNGTAKACAWVRALRASIAGVCLLVIPAGALAQSSGGALRGTITDPSGAVVQNATVTIVGDGTVETRRL